jgi:hypothetical protein
METPDMTQSHPLDKVIRCLDMDWSPSRLEADERIVTIDARAGEVLAKKPLLGFKRDVRRYLVSTRGRTEKCQGPVCRIKSPVTLLSLEFEVNYEPRCEKGNEDRMALALSRGQQPSSVVERFITDRVHDFVDRENASAHDVCLEFPQLRGFMQSFVSESARSELGLTLELTIVPRLEKELKTVPVELNSFPVRVCDQDEQVDLKVSTELEVDPENRMRALLYLQHQQIADPADVVVRQVIRKMLAEEVTFHAFSYDLKGKVRSRLIEALNLRLRTEGRKVTFLRLEPGPQTKEPSPEIPQIEHTVDCKIADCEDVIPIKHRLKLILRDLGRFHGSGIRDLAAWVTTRLDEITRDVLFERRYLNVLLDFVPDEAEIKSRMEREAHEIGYTVRQLVAVPALEPLRWKEEGFLLEDIEGTFGTRDSRIDVRLNVVVKGKIGDLRDPRLQRFLSPRSRLLESIRELVLRETRQMIHGVSPEHFYMRFAYSDDPAEPAVREMIETRIGTVLSELYGIEDLGVIPKPLETDLTKRLDLLQRGPHKLVVTCAPLDRGGEEVSYRIDFDVLGVPAEGWYVFRTKSYDSTEAELEMVREVIAEDVKSKLQVAPKEIVQFTELGRYQDLSQVIQRSVREKVERVFGLRIQIINMNRLATYGEQKSKDAVKYAIDTSMETGKEILANKRADLALLYGKRSEMINSGVEGDDPILADLEQRIRKLEQEIAPDQMERGQQEVKSLLPAPTEGSRAEEWKRLALANPSVDPVTDRVRLTGEVDEKAS